MPPAARILGHRGVGDREDREHDRREREGTGPLLPDPNGITNSGLVRRTPRAAASRSRRGRDARQTDGVPLDLVDVTALRRRRRRLRHGHLPPAEIDASAPQPESGNARSLGHALSSPRVPASGCQAARSRLHLVGARAPSYPQTACPMRSHQRVLPPARFPAAYRFACSSARSCWPAALKPSRSRSSG